MSEQDKEKENKQIKQQITAEWIKKNGYKGFGSFFSDNVEEILNNPNYTPPKYPSFTNLSHPIEIPKCGKEVKKYFLLDEEFTFINHGAFGAVPSPILKVSNQWFLLPLTSSLIYS